LRAELPARLSGSLDYFSQAAHWWVALPSAIWPGQISVRQPVSRKQSDGSGGPLAAHPKHRHENAEVKLLTPDDFGFATATTKSRAAGKYFQVCIPSAWFIFLSQFDAQ